MKDSKYYKKKMLQLKKKKELKNYFWLSQMLISIIIVLVSLILTNLSSDIKAKYVNDYLSKNISFASINNLYKKYIGGSKNKKDDMQVANVGNVNVPNKEKIGNSFKLNVGVDYPITTLKPGIIVYIGEKDDLGNTVIIQGNDGIDIWYSNIIISDYSLYDYVSEGVTFGVNNEDYYLITIVKDGQYLEYDEYFS